MPRSPICLPECQCCRRLHLHRGPLSGVQSEWDMAAVPSDAWFPCSEVHGGYHWLERPVGSWETNRSLTRPSCWKLWPQLQSECLGNTFQVQLQGGQLLLDICQGCSQGSLKARRPCSGCGPDPTLSIVTVCIKGSHPWVPMKEY